MPAAALADLEREVAIQETLIKGYQRENERLVLAAKAEQEKRLEAEAALAAQQSSTREQDMKFQLD